MTEKPKVSFFTSLYRGQDFLEGYFGAVLAIKDLSMVEIIIVHNDPQDQELAVIEKYRKSIPNFVHVSVEREPVYCSWNRAIAIARGSYIGMWNVDDVRTEKGIWSQINKLDEDKNNFIVSGDFTKVFSYGSKSGIVKKDPVKKKWISDLYKFNNGCFLLWRRELHDLIGYFDEQFKVVGDWEFWMRACAHTFPVRAEADLGYYLRENNSGLSKSKYKFRNVEEFIVRFRYYRFFIENPYNYFFSSHDFQARSFVNFNIKKPLPQPYRFNILSLIASFLFFWIPALTRVAVELKFYIFSKRHARSK